MRRLIILFVVLLISIWIGLLAHKSPGYVLITYNQWSLETTLWLGLLLLLLVMTVLYALIRIISNLIAMPSNLRFWSKRRHQRKANKLTYKGLSELVTGNWSDAEKNLTKAADNSVAPLINYLAAAKAAQKLQNVQQRDEYLRKAHEAASNSDIAVGLTQARLQMESEQLEQALATLQHLNQISPHQKYILQLLQTIYFKLNDWENTRLLLPELKKYKVLDEKKLDALTQQTYANLLSKDKINWNDVPRTLRKNPTIVCSYANKLISKGQESNAEQLIKESIHKCWDPQLLEIYSHLKSKDTAKLLNRARTWLRNHNDDPMLLLCLGRLCRRNKLWGQAKSYLQSSINIKPSRNAYSELGQVLEQLGENDDALKCYKQGLEIS